MRSGELWYSKESPRAAGSAATVIASKGNSVVRISMRRGQPDDDTLLTHMLGRTGNLRAPMIRVGNTLLVGFNEEVYAEALR